MEKGFLNDLAAELSGNYPEGMQDVWVVFPNRRAGIFFTRALAACIDKPVWSPRILSFEDFIYSLTGKERVDQLMLVLDLFEVFREKISPEETFDKFYFWGDMLLRDFDETDKYLVNPDDIFTTMKNLKEIDLRFQDFTDEQKAALSSFWSSTGGKASHHKTQFILFWKQLKGLYHDFQKMLKKKGYGYQGMIYRELVDQMDRDQFKWEKGEVIFAGFNALTLAEEKIIKWFLGNAGATIRWDIDQYYFDDPKHEAGHFLRKYYRDKVFKPGFPTQVPDHFRKQQKHISLYASSQYTGQTRIAGTLVNELAGARDFTQMEDTAIILPDENLLPLLLYGLPAELDRINITMGYALRNSAFYSLIDLLLELQERARKGKDKEWFNHRPVTGLLNHPLMSSLTDPFRENLMQRITGGNMIYIPADLLDGEETLRDIFRMVDRPEALIDYLIQTLMTIRRSMDEAGEERFFFEKEFSIEIYKFLNRLKASLQQRDVALTIRLLRNVIRSYARFEKIPFTGEPLEGLQIMGLLETRNLDFKHVIVLCMNEGSIPRSASLHSFIPYNVRKAFGLPLPDHEDAMYAYLFYRLIQRAEHVHLIYNTEETYNKNAEPSRFIQQLKFESGKEIRKQELMNKVSVAGIEPVRINKDPGVMERLKRFLAGRHEHPKFLTPSKLNQYLACPLTFCYRNVFDLEERVEVTEDLDYPKFGNILHKTMELVYLPFTGRELREKDFKILLERVNDAVQKGFAHYHGYRENTESFRFEGQNILGREIIIKFARKILDHDQKAAPFRILGLEKPYEMALPLELDGQQEKVLIRGTIDRIDRRDDTIRIIDYKSGKDSSKFKGMDSLFDAEDKNRNKAVFQTFLYALLYQQNHPENQLPLQPGIYNFNEIHNPDFDLRLREKQGGRHTSQPIADVRPELQTFEKMLRTLLMDIFNPAIPFAHHENVDQCMYCSSLGAPSEFV